MALFLQASRWGASIIVKNHLEGEKFDQDAKRAFEPASSKTFLLQHLCSIVFERVAYVADTFGPRFSGTPGLERAIDYIKVRLHARHS
jgi:hypothetical protein